MLICPFPSILMDAIETISIHCLPNSLLSLGLQPQQVGLSVMVGAPVAMEMWKSHRTEVM